MTKYKVSKAAMDELNGLKELKLHSIWDLIVGLDIGSELFKWIYYANSDVEHEQAVIDYAINGADNFEVKKPTWGIVSKKASKDGYYISLTKANFVDNLKAWSWGFYDSQSKSLDGATRITDPKLKDALVYANKDFEAIEVEK